MNTSQSFLPLALAALITSGCASTPAAMSQQTADAAEMYEGEPEVVFATEFPIASAQDAIARADRALAEGDSTLALYLYVRAYDLDEDNVYALLRIGQIHESRGNDRLAARAYRSTLSADATNSRALQALGLLSLKARHYDDAQACLERAVQLDPSLWRAYDGIGIIADVRAEHEVALAAFNAALAIKPDEASVLNNRGYSNYMAGRYRQAEQDLLAAAALGADKAWLNLGLVRARQGRYLEAVQMMAKTVDLEVAYNDVGYIAMREGDLDVAERYFQKAIRTAPRYFAAAQQNLGELREMKPTSGGEAETIALRLEDYPE